MTKINFNLDSNEDELYQASIVDDGIILSDKLIDVQTLSKTMGKYLDEQELKRIRIATKLFKSKNLTIKLKD